MDTARLAAQLRERLAILLDNDPATITANTEFAELGVDSMMRLELIALVEQHLGFELPEQQLAGLTTIGRVIEYVSTFGD